MGYLCPAQRRGLINPKTKDRRKRELKHAITNLSSCQ